MSIVIRTISEQAYQLMRERILTGSLPAGAPVRQDAVAEELGVSKIPLREALSRLEQDGLLSSSPTAATWCARSPPRRRTRCSSSG